MNHSTDTHKSYLDDLSLEELFSEADKIMSKPMYQELLPLGTKVTFYGGYGTGWVTGYRNYTVPQYTVTGIHQDGTEGEIYLDVADASPVEN